MFRLPPRLVFTSDGVGVGVGVGVVIRSVELYHLVKSERSDSAHDSVVYDQVESRLSESQVKVEELNQSQSVGKCIAGLVYPSASASDSDKLVFTRS